METIHRTLYCRCDCIKVIAFCISCVKMLGSSARWHFSSIARKLVVKVLFLAVRGDACWRVQKTVKNETNRTTFLNSLSTVLYARCMTR
jgi:hypothetical protein